MRDQRVGIGNPAHDAVLLVTAAREEIGRWKHRHRDAGFARAACRAAASSASVRAGIFVAVADRDASAPAHVDR